MAQISIPMANKVGYSMYWNSMWDSKKNFSRALKEDIFLKTFIPLIFNDNISNRVLKTIRHNDLIKSTNFKKYNIHIKSENFKKNVFYKYMSNLNKLIFFSSNVWLIKYQKWVIIYFFMYIPKFSNLKNKYKINDFIYSNIRNSSSINDLFYIYKLISFKLNYSYNFFNKNINKNYF